MGRDPDWKTLREEFELVVSRHNDLLSRDPKYFAATIFHLADMVREKNHIGIDAVTDEGDGLWLIHFEGGSHVAGLGIVGQPERFADLDVSYGEGGPFIGP